MADKESEYYRRRAEAEIAIAIATGAAKAYASIDNRVIFVERRDGTKETVRLQRPDVTH